MRTALYPLESGSSLIMSTEITCQCWSGTLLGISFPTFCVGKVFIWLHMSHPATNLVMYLTALATSSSMTPALASSNVWGVWRLWHCDVHALGHDGAGGCLGCRPCLNTGQHLLCMSTHQSGVPPHLRPSGLSPQGHQPECSLGSVP